ncbi:DUF4062 domain-containing protein [Microbacterium sp. X-17]|uniref:DUF4062 domain-containing protein n=1 Tax=Microbacterium sp. X-17 TaxID=3144404 RepID=UPI0031F57C02
MDTRYQVFVSSTYTDLIDERREVMQALLELDCIPAGMELFPSANEDQWTLIQEVIDQSDYYLVIVGGRYGTVSAEGLSYTEKEYDYAVAQKIPVLGFVHADPDAIVVGKSELDVELRERLMEFRKKVQQRMVKHYRGAEDLGSVVSRALTRAIKRNPRPGWVRGDQAMTDSVRAEIAELRASLAEARQAQDRAKLDADITAIDVSFEHGDDELTLTFVITSGFNFRQDVDLEYTWDELIEVLGPFMIHEAPEGQLRKIVEDRAWTELIGMGQNWEELPYPKTHISDESWGRLVVQLRALGMITAGTKKRTVSDREVYWGLTAAGDAYLVRLLATKRAPQSAGDES